MTEPIEKPNKEAGEKKPAAPAAKTAWQKEKELREGIQGIEQALDERDRRQEEVRKESAGAGWESEVQKNKPPVEDCRRRGGEEDSSMKILLAALLADRRRCGHPGLARRGGGTDSQTIDTVTDEDSH